MQDQDLSRKTSGISLKLCIFGDGGVGKTTLIDRYLTGVFTESTIMTIGVEFHIKNIEIQGRQIALHIWDFAGEERFRHLLPSYVRGASGGIFMFDLTRFTTLNNINNWSEVINACTDENIRPLPIILVGGKLDLVEKRAISSDYGNKLKSENKLFFDYIESSSLTGENVDKIFRDLAQEILKRKDLI